MWLCKFPRPLLSNSLELSSHCIDDPVWSSDTLRCVNFSTWKYCRNPTLSLECGLVLCYLLYTIFHAVFPKLMVFILTKIKINARSHNRQTAGNKAEYTCFGERRLSIRKLIFVSDLQQPQQITKLWIALQLLFFLLSFSWHLLLTLCLKLIVWRSIVKGALKL